MNSKVATAYFLHLTGRIYSAKMYNSSLNIQYKAANASTIYSTFQYKLRIFISKDITRLVDFCLLLLSFLSPITLRITIAAKPSGHVPFHSLAVFWSNNVSIAARATHVFAQCNRLKGLMTINNYELKTEGQRFSIKHKVQKPPLWV